MAKSTMHAPFTVTIVSKFPWDGFAAPPKISGVQRSKFPDDDASTKIRSAAQTPQKHVPPFRLDLDWETQVAQAAYDKELHRRATIMAEWKQTFATKDNHRYMLCALVVEAARRRKAAGFPLPTRTVATLINGINQDLTAPGTHGRDGNCIANVYIAALNRLAAMNLFE